MSSLRHIFYKEMITVCFDPCERIMSHQCAIKEMFLPAHFSFQLNSDLQNVMKDLQAQHPDKAFSVRGVQR